MLVAMAGTGRVVYVSGFSKSIMPSMRVGYVVANDALLKEFAKTKMSMGLTTPEMMERLVYQVLSQGRSEEHTSELQSLMRISYAVFCLTKNSNHHSESH